ncbi:MAG: substrate-binding domain-containing protein [Clostridia bacterium]|nr:substrate-binding domain-containing protein [Clostridia bacterium]
MKKILALVLVVALALTAMVSCSINDKEVAVIWAKQTDDFSATMADALDRALYIENIKYKHYDANGDSDAQKKLVDDAIAGGAPALVLNPCNDVVALHALKAAKEANIPLIFMCATGILDTVLNLVQYDKVYSIDVDAASLTQKLGERIAKDLIENANDKDKKNDYDRNGDGKISYAFTDVVSLEAIGNSLLVQAIEKYISESNAAVKPVLEAAIFAPKLTAGENVTSIFEGFTGAEGNDKVATNAELLLSMEDGDIDDILLAMRAYQLNYNKLVTHFIPLYTVGVSANAGSLLAETAKDEEKAAYSVMNTIDSGYVSAAALEDDDAMATAAAVILRNFIKGNEPLKDVVADYVDGKKISVPYTIYG